MTLPGFGTPKWVFTVVGDDKGRSTVEQLKPADARALKDPRVTTSLAAKGKAPAPPLSLTNADVLALKRGGFSDEFIIDQIRASKAAYVLDEPELEKLREVGVSSAVIAAMKSAAERKP